MQSHLHSARARYTHAHVRKILSHHRSIRRQPGQCTKHHHDLHRSSLFERDRHLALAIVLCYTHLMVHGTVGNTQRTFWQFK